MITFLSSPKAFIGQIDVIQKNAIRSWKAVYPDVEVIIYGDGERVAETCREMGVHHVPDIQCSPSDTPYFNSIVEHSNIHARHDIQCYLNCDILMTESVITAIKSLMLPRYLLIGQRMDLADNTNLDVTTNNWEKKLQQLKKQGKANMHAPSGMDYFIFPRGLWKELPKLVIGRGGYDNALLAFCIGKRIPIIDATASIVAFHQFHDYRHISNGQKEVMDGKEAEENKRIHKVLHSAPIVSDANYRLIDGNLLGIKFFGYRLRKLELSLRFQKRLPSISYILRIIARGLGMVRYK